MIGSVASRAWRVASIILHGAKVLATACADRHLWTPLPRVSAHLVYRKSTCITQIKAPKGLKNSRPLAPTRAAELRYNLGVTSTQNWPERDLQTLGCCPLCGCKQRKVLHDELEDVTTRGAPGRWTLHSCGGCAAAYLDPRPTPASIVRAYAGYDTHEAHAESAPANLIGILRAAARNGHLRSKWGIRREPASAALDFILMRMPVVLSRLIDEGELRGLPRPAERRLLLDVGCGNGSFLHLASEAGWNVRGIDFDADAVEAARRAGLDVSLGPIESLAEESNRYDAITLGHVIEHVHDPRGTLSACLRLLKPGGWLWIETPNVESRGHARFGRHWRGLEAPRHLILFHPRALRALLEDVGFRGVSPAPWRPSYPWMEMASRAVREGRSQDSLRSSVSERALAAFVECANIFSPARREYVTLTAGK